MSDRSGAPRFRFGQNTLFEEAAMKAFILAVVVAVAVAIGAAWLLQTQQRSVAEAFTTEAVRVGDPGSNLVGPWSNTNTDHPGAT
jgi:hypothetical protein